MQHRLVTGALIGLLALALLIPISSIEAGATDIFFEGFESGVGQFSHYSSWSYYQTDSGHYVNGTHSLYMADNFYSSESDYAYASLGASLPVHVSVWVAYDYYNSGTNCIYPMLEIQDGSGGKAAVAAWGDPGIGGAYRIAVWNGASFDKNTSFTSGYYGSFQQVQAWIYASNLTLLFNGRYLNETFSTTLSAATYLYIADTSSAPGYGCWIDDVEVSPATASPAASWHNGGSGTGEGWYIIVPGPPTPAPAQPFPWPDTGLIVLFIIIGSAVAFAVWWRGHR
jgi:hypothetical protein